ncbi:MAG: hypothetical protein J6C33_05190 [Lachnospiraceae bacterium]|nr:hypothetical protein [Lachnospiraceae bacterium]
MNEQNNETYSFCPKCGALMENGVCPHCSEAGSQGVYSSQHYPQAPARDDGQGNPCQNQNPCGQGNPYQNQNPYGQGDPYQSQSPYGQSNPYQNQNPYGQGSPYQNQIPYGQGGFYQNPYVQNGYHPYMKPKKDNKIWIILGIAVAALIILLTLVGSYFYGYFITKTISSMDGADFYAGEYNFDDGGEDEYGRYDGTEEESGSETEQYVPSPDDEYYYGPCDAIDESVDYSFVTKSYSNEDAENDIDIAVNYFELKGENIPNLESLNEAIETAALYYAEDFPKNSYYAEYGNSYCVYTSAYVTYNDADIVSIVLDEYVILDGEYHVDLYPINIDVKNGVILDNASLLSIDEEFAGEFRRRNNEQNGEINYLESLSDKQLADVLRDKNSVVAYYTPLGMEIGLNYSEEGNSGWVTVTYKDYEKYLTNF